MPSILASGTITTMTSAHRTRTDSAVRFRDTDQGQRQRDALRAAERDSGRKRSAIVADLDAEINIGHDQFLRYLRGDTPLRWDQIGVFARALGCTQAGLTRALGLLDDEREDIRARSAEALGPTWADGAPETVEAMTEGLLRLSPADRARVLEQITEGRPCLDV
jgi:hypothetical protein